jgi:carbonic anhydrase
MPKLTEEMEASADGAAWTECLADERLVDAVKRGASMEEIAKLRDPAASSPQEAVERLKEGNIRFFTGKTDPHVLNMYDRRSQILAQTPFAIVLACSDSRVPVETVFDQGPGDLFVVRVAGNVAEPVTMASVEYAVQHLKSQLVMVMGHEGCGAVEAAMGPAGEGTGSDNLDQLLGLIRPAVSELPSIRDKKALMREAVVANVRLQAQQVMDNAIVRAAVEKGRLAVVGAFYEIGSGVVDFFRGEELDP